MTLLISKYLHLYLWQDCQQDVAEAKEWYWDYDEGIWKECDPDEEYEWEYIDDEDNEENKTNCLDIQATVKLAESNKNQLSDVTESDLARKFEESKLKTIIFITTEK